MSRPPALPATPSANRRAFSPGPPPINNASITDSRAVPSTTRPLQIGRSSRPTTPGSVVSELPTGPSRPQRSGARARVPSDYSASDMLSTSSRISNNNSAPSTRDRSDSASLRSFDTSRPSQSRSIVSPAPPSAPNASRTRSNTSGTEDSAVSPTSMSAIKAFQNAGARQRYNGSYDAEYEKEKERERELQKARQQRIRDRAPGRRTNGKSRAGDIDAILDEIKDEWAFVVDTDFNPVDLALQLLDRNSAGKDMKSFRQTAQMLSKALKGSVDKHHQAFNASLPQHAALLNHLSASQDQLKEARAALSEAKEALGSKRADLVQLWTRGQVVEDMISMLNRIEHLKAVPDVLESLMSEKRLLQAAVLLVRSLKMINKPDMMEVGATSDLRAYLNGQETMLRDILVDELHAHLYLKSFWCESRWTAYSSGQQTLRHPDFEDEALVDPLQLAPTSPTTPLTPKGSRPRLMRYMDNLTLRPNESPYDLSEPNFRNSTQGVHSSSAANSLASSAASKTILFSASSAQNPEADSFSYIEMLLESLAVLGKLGSGLDVVAQRLPGEIFALVESTVEEVSERAEYGRRTSTYGMPTSTTALDSLYSAGLTIMPVQANMLMTGPRTTSIGPTQSALLNAQALRLSSLESSAKHTDHETIRDLFWTVYSKLDAVMQGLRIVFEVANRIGSRRDFKDSSGAKPGSLFPLAEIWTPIQAEIRTLLNDYISDGEQGASAGRNPLVPINEVLRDGRFSRDRNKPVYRFSDTDLKSSTNTLRQHEEELTRVLRDSVPGLVQGSSENAIQATIANIGADDRMLGINQHHRLLIHPDAFHVSVLFQPTLAFLERVADVMPAGLESARAASTVLDEFVKNVYLPQLEEKVLDLFQQAVGGPDAFQPDPASYRLSPQPLIKASTHLMALINSLCAMLRTTPFHRENYSRLILGVIVQFYQRCSDRFQALISGSSSTSSLEGDPRMTLAADWSQRPELSSCLVELLNASDPAKRTKLCAQETHLELSFLDQKEIQRHDLIASVRNLGEVAQLYHSTAWFASQLNKLKAIPEESMSPTTPLNADPLSALSPFTPGLPLLQPLLPDEELQLPLTRNMSLRLQALLKTYDLLGELMLSTIRVDIRCRVVHHLSLAMRQNFRPDREIAEPDAQVSDLAAELADCDDAITLLLPQLDKRFVFDGVGQLMERIFISQACHIRTMNAYGASKMNRNILALQQSIKSFVSDSDLQRYGFERAKLYYALFNATPTDMLDGIKQKQIFEFEEYQVMLNLMCGVDSTLRDAGAAQATDKNYSTYMIELHGLELEKENGEEVG